LLRDCAMGQVVCCRSSKVEARVQSQPGPYEIFRWTKTDFCLGALILYVSIIAPTFHTQLHIYSVLIRRTIGRSLGTFRLSSGLSVIKAYWTVFPYCVFIIT
jgi:hypothetical protein